MRDLDDFTIAHLYLTLFGGNGVGAVVKFKVDVKRQALIQFDLPVTHRHRQELQMISFTIVGSRDSGDFSKLSKLPKYLNQGKQ